MKEQFCNYEIALKLKELGFNEPCAGWIDETGFQSVWIREVRNADCHANNCALPLWQQVIDWLRVTHKICVIQDLHPDMSCSYDPSEQYFQFNLVRINNNGTKNALHPMDRGRDFNSYQDGREWMILKAIELCQ